MILFATTNWNKITIEIFRKVRGRNNIFNTEVVLQKFFRIRKNSDNVDDGEERWKILFVLLLYKNDSRETLYAQRAFFAIYATILLSQEMVASSFTS